MPEKKQKTDKIKFYLFVGAMIIIFTAIIDIALVSDQTKKNVNAIFNEVMLGKVTQNALEYEEALDAVKTGTDAASSLIGTWEDLNDEKTADILDSIVNSTEAYHAAYIKENGAVVNSRSGYEVMTGDGYDAGFENKTFFYMKSDGFSGRSAFVYPVVLGEGNDAEGVVLAFVDGKDVSTTLSQLANEEKLLESRVLMQDVVYIYTAGSYQADFEEGDLWLKIKDLAIDRKEYGNFIYAKNMRNPGKVDIRIGKEDYSVYLIPFSQNKLSLLAVVEKEYIQDRVDEYRSGERALRNSVIVFLLLIVLFFVALNIYNKSINKKKSETLENKAETDLLTNLSNKIAAERKIKEYIEQNPNGHAVLFIIDIDNFKNVNDTRGHAFGDEVIREVAHQLKAISRITDVVGRMGGDEFVVLLKDVKDSETVKSYGKRMEQTFQGFQVGEYVKYSVTCSIGAALFSEDADSFDALYHAADKALYKAKRRGKNQLAYFRDEEEKIEKQ